MKKIVYVNGTFCDADEAKISIFDRGLLFADAVYEVSPIIKSKLIDNQAHLNRLKRSLDQLQMPSPVSNDELIALQNKLIKINDINEGFIYFMITRGSSIRNFAFPKNCKPSLIIFTQEAELLNSPHAENGISIITTPDIRWNRRDIKTVNLLAQCLAKQEAVSCGANDAWMIENGYITEGTSNNAFIITSDNKIITRPLSNDILHGVTREKVLIIAKENQIKIEERPFTLEEAYHAKEAFITSSAIFIWPVIKINNRPIGKGLAGPITKKLRRLYIENLLKECCDMSVVAPN